MILNIVIMLVVTAIIIVVASRHERFNDYTPPAKATPRLTIENVIKLYEDGQLTCRPGYLHYDMKPTTSLDEDKDIIFFTGICIPDSQHDAQILVLNEEHEIIGRIASQKKLYTTLLTKKYSYCYGFIAKNKASEVCLFNPNN
jgi:hypothetical protein